MKTDQTLYDFQKLANAEGGVSAIRRLLLERMINTDEIYPCSMVVRCMSNYDATRPHNPLQFAFMNDAMINASPEKQLQTWNYLSQIFSFLQKGKNYHFLCYRDKDDKKNNYYPILLVEELIGTDSYLRSKSSSLYHLSKDRPIDYLRYCEKNNQVFVQSITPKSKPNTKGPRF